MLIKKWELIKIFKINTAIKIILFLIILTFFLPFFVVSCGEQELSVSGLETATVIKNGNYVVLDGNPAAFILIIPAAILLILTFFTGKIKEEIKNSFFFKNIFMFAAVFNIFAAVTIRIAAQIIINKEIAGLHRGLADFVTFRAGYGFILYIILNAALLVLSGANYFVNLRNNLLE